MTIEWSGRQKRTRIIFDNFSPTFNEDIFFRIPIDGGLKNKKGDFRKEGLQKLGRILENNNEIILSVWVDSRKGNYEFIGQSILKIRELMKGVERPLKFYDKKARKERKEPTRQVELSLPLVSGYSTDMNTNISVSLLLFPFIDETQFSFGNVPLKSISKLSPTLDNLLKSKINKINSTVIVLKDSFPTSK